MHTPATMIWVVGMADVEDKKKSGSGSGSAGWSGFSRDSRGNLPQSRPQKKG